MSLGAPTIDRPQSGSVQAWPEILAGAATSLLLHGLIVAIVLISVLLSKDSPGPENEIIFEEVELLALGEPRDPNQLPRITGDDPLPPQDELLADDDVADVASQREIADPEPGPDPEVLRLQRQQEVEERQEAERERRRQERLRRMDQAMGRFEADGPGDEAPEGSDLGVAGGTVTDEALADMMQTFQVRVLQEIQRLWEVPITISSEELARLAGQVRVLVRLAESGHIVSYRMVAKSGNEQFDESIERVLQRFERQRGGRALPMPEQAEVLDQVLRQGLVLTNWEFVER